MFNPSIKKVVSTLLIFGAIIAAYFLLPKTTNTETSNLLTHAETKHLEQEKVIQQRLYEDFEDAFVKQYTPPINCEILENKTQSIECINHQIEAKQAFKHEFIKLRGLPKDTFQGDQLSFKN